MNSWLGETPSLHDHRWSSFSHLWSLKTSLTGLDFIDCQPEDLPHDIALGLDFDSIPSELDSDSDGKLEQSFSYMQNLDSGIHKFKMNFNSALIDVGQEMQYIQHVKNVRMHHNHFSGGVGNFDILLWGPDQDGIQDYAFPAPLVDNPPPNLALRNHQANRLIINQILGRGGAPTAGPDTKSINKKKRRRKTP